MLVGRCLNAHTTLPGSRSKACPHRCCSFISSAGHQQPQLAHAAARTSATSEVFQSAPVAGHLSGLLQLLDGTQPEVSAQAQLNIRLTRCTSWREIAALLDANLDFLDFVNISTAWTRLATLFKTTGQHRNDGQPDPAAPPVRDPEFRRFLAMLIGVTSQQLRVFGMQALANVMWALSNADWELEQHEPAASKLVHEWCACVHDRLPELRGPDVSNISTAIGRLDHRWRPGFVVGFYRSVLRQQDLLDKLDLTTLNNLLYGMSRARQRGLTHMGPATRRLLGQCIDRLLSRPDREAARLVPWRAAQLLYNCHKVKLRMHRTSYAVLMPLVAEVYACDPNPLDRWSMSYLTGFVDAHRDLHPAARPDMRPLYDYVERRLPEASTSQMAMLAHAFRGMGVLPPAQFWGQLFSRYLVAQPLPCPAPPPVVLQAAHAVSRPAVQQQRQWQALELPDGRSSQKPEQQVQGPLQEQESVPQQLLQQQQRQNELMQVLPPAELHRQPYSALLSRPQPAQVQAQVQHIQQQALQAWQLQRPGRAAWGESFTDGRPVEPHRAPQPHRSLHQQQQQHQDQQPRLQSYQSLHSSQQPRWPLSSPDCTAGQLQASLQQPRPHLQQQPSLPPHSQPLLPASCPPPSQQQQPGAAAAAAPPSPQLRLPQQQPSGQPQPLAQELLQRPPSPPPQRQAPRPHSPHARTHPRPSPHPYPFPSRSRAPAQPDLADEVPRLAVAMALRDRDRVGGGLAASRGDDLGEPRTLHYVCWQAAKAGILPPRAFLRLYVDRVPQWLVRSADDAEVAQAVETLQLLRWVPRQELRDMLCATLEWRAPSSRLPMRALLRWVQQQR